MKVPTFYFQKLASDCSKGEIWLYKKCLIMSTTLHTLQIYNVGQSVLHTSLIMLCLFFLTGILNCLHNDLKFCTVQNVALGLNRII